MKRRTIPFICILFLGMLPLCVSATVYYVKAGGTGDGSSWINASGDLQAMIDSADAQSGNWNYDEIWVAEGIYYPSNCTSCNENDRVATFLVSKNIKIYGGFPDSDCASLADRDWVNHPTILSGDIGIAGNNADNSYHVLSINHPVVGTYQTLIDGITIKDGNANDSFNGYTSGAGIYCLNGRMELLNCFFLNNTATGNGAAYFNGSDDRCSIEFCVFENNTSSKGGAIYLRPNFPAPADEHYSPIINCSFKNNSATIGGGAICLDTLMHARIFGCLFQSNDAPLGGAIYLIEPLTHHYEDYDDEDSYTASKIINCTFVNNTAALGGSCVNLEQAIQPLTLTSCIIWSNQSPAFSIQNAAINKIYLAGILTDAANHDILACCNLISNTDLASRNYFNSSNPFKDYANNDFTLHSESTATNRGWHPQCISCDDDGSSCNDPEEYDLLDNVDLLGHPRILTKPDIGAYEFFDANSHIPILYVNPNATGINNGLSWTDAHLTLEDAFKKARNYTVDQIWIAAGTYQPIDCAFYNCQGDSTDYTFELTFRKGGKLYIYGGFPDSGNPTLEDRDWVNYPTIITGELGDPNNFTDNIDLLMFQEYFASDNVTLNGITFTASSDIALRADHIIVENCTFSENETGLLLQNYGYCRPGGTARNSTFVNNRGRGAVIRGASPYGGATLRLCGSKFINNMGGGARAFADANIIATNCTFSNNSSPNSGGALSVTGDSDLKADGCHFFDNSAFSEGGAIYFGGEIFSVLNSLFVQNHSSMGAALTVFADQKKLSNCTFYNNTAEIGGSIYYGGDLEVSNSIFWNHENPFLTNYEITLKNTLSNFFNCDSLGVSVNCLGVNLFDTLSPFIDIATQNFQLAEGSAAINQGDNIFIDLGLNYLDIVGNYRIKDNIVDIGAYEYDASNQNYVDEDNDGYFSILDCDDSNPSINPCFAEIPYNGQDDDCNPLTPDDDIDHDGYPLSSDCNDTNYFINPGAIEIINNNIDEDCNPNSATNDLDQDGFTNNDCDDNNPLVNPCMPEIPYNGLDDDCNPDTQDDDFDGDGFGIAADCNDNDPLVNNGNTEMPFNGIDDDCNLATLDNDQDQDGFSVDNDCDDNNALVNSGISEIPYNGIDDDCNEATLDDDLDQDSYNLVEDCNDNNPMLNINVDPNAVEIPYNGLDDDCNSATPDDDLDGDGFVFAADCNDNDPLITAAAEIPYNGIDDDCNPTTLDDDFDQDGFLLANDCDDNDAAFPVAPGVACDDGDPLTDEDVIQANGCTCTGNYNGAAPILDWVVPISGNGIDAGHDITTDKWGNVYVTGIFRETVDFDPGPGIHNLISSGNTDIYVAKYNAAAQLIWAYSFGGITNYDNAYSITTDTSGNVYVSGIFVDDVDFDPGPNEYYLTSGNRDIFILKLNKDGTFIWAKEMNTSSYYSFENSILVDSEENVYATGAFSQDMDFDPGLGVFQLSASYSPDVFMLKLNSDGSFAWAKSLGTSSSISGDAIALDTYNNVFILGNYSSTIMDFDPGPGQFSITSSGFSSKLFLLKLNNNGDFIWVKQIEAYGHDMEIDDADNIYLTGAFGSITDLNPGTGVYYLSNYGSSQNIFVSKLNKDGEFMWAKAMSGVSPDMVLDANNNVYTFGEFEGTVDFDPGAGVYYLSSTTSYISNMFIQKLDGDGFFQWAGAFTGQTEDYYYSNGNAITLDIWDNIYTTSDFNNKVDFDPNQDIYELTALANTDAFIHKLQQLPCGQEPYLSASDSIHFCNTDSLQLWVNMPSGVSALSYSWSTGDNSDSIFILPNAAVIYTLEVYYSPACISVLEIKIPVSTNNIEIIYNGIDEDCNAATLDDDLDQDGFNLADDCDDNNPSVGGLEIPYNGIDEDCNAATLDDDLDQDGFNLANDCDDNNNLINPASAENIYNGVDDDCNATTQDDDLDQDGFNLGDDCDDNNPALGGLEIPYNGIDDDCNTTTLDNDLDQDGFNLASDCNDNNPLINPAAAEIIYNGIDDDCNVVTIDDDLDQDGFNLADDCDDNNPLINPTSLEIIYNGFNDDCNPATLDDDFDQDGFNLADDCDDNDPFVGGLEIPYNGINEDCNEATSDDDLDQDGFLFANDCDDNNAEINPNSSEIPYNGNDDDCNPATLDDDLDGDGYNLAFDCNDGNPFINMDATEIPYNGFDDDCNSITPDDDLDNDGFSISSDCDDENNLINPATPEIPNNGIDEDCDGTDLITIATNNISATNPQIFPNPASDVLHVFFPKGISGNYELRDIAGKLILHNNFDHKTEITMTHLSQGIYTLILKTETQTWIEKVVKM